MIIKRHLGKTNGSAVLSNFGGSPGTYTRRERDEAEWKIRRYEDYVGC